MQPIPTLKQENSAFLQLLLLGVYSIVGLLVFMVIGFGIAFLCYGTVLFKDLSWLSGNNLELIGALKIMLTAQQFGLFLTPALLLAVTEGQRFQRFYGLKMPKSNIMLIVFLIMFCAMPMMSLVNELNQKMVLPEFLKGLENWMRKLEDEGAVTTKAILNGTSISALLVNLLVVGLVPAVCEELIFRGALQRIFLRMIKNPHVAIWTSAIIFSTIHFQFFGFFPRLLLGAGFGYIYFWTGSIWYTVFAHLLNNGYAVIVAWYFQKHNMPIDSDDGTSVAWYGYIISAILTIALLKFLKDKTAKPIAE